MGEGNNLFNTFSFNVWKADNAEAQADKANKKRRKKQVRKLKAALRADKLGKPGGGGGMSPEELAALLAILAAEDSGGDNDTESDVNDDTLAEVPKNAYLKMMQDAGMGGGYDDGLFKYNRSPNGAESADRIAPPNTFVPTIQNYRPPDPPVNPFNPYPMGLQAIGIPTRPEPPPPPQTNG
ncbi:unnamed protein product [Sphagnum balticum]